LSGRKFDACFWWTEIKVENINENLVIGVLPCAWLLWFKFLSRAVVLKLRIWDSPAGCKFIIKVVASIEKRNKKITSNVLFCEVLISAVCMFAGGVKCVLL
jgi:hypothetical protein